MDIFLFFSKLRTSLRTHILEPYEEGRKVGREGRRNEPMKTFKYQMSNFSFRAHSFLNGEHFKEHILGLHE